MLIRFCMICKTPHLLSGLIARSRASSERGIQISLVRTTVWRRCAERNIFKEARVEKRDDHGSNYVAMQKVRSLEAFFPQG